MSNSPDGSVNENANPPNLNGHLVPVDRPYSPSASTETSYTAHGPNSGTRTPNSNPDFNHARPNFGPRPNPAAGSMPYGSWYDNRWGVNNAPPNRASNTTFPEANGNWTPGLAIDYMNSRAANGRDRNGPAYWHSNALRRGHTQGPTYNDLPGGMGPVGGAWPNANDGAAVNGPREYGGNWPGVRMGGQGGTPASYYGYADGHQNGNRFNEANGRYGENNGGQGGYWGQGNGASGYPNGGQ
ncbi:hypothetical protein C8035_v001023 [Colletotrichum spinosum]|uniref:Uncharacterized protein n=1 Tax=Colletotrichum spinosum TaxID=1347390 RepID=A0A4R8Q1Z6_9PEZI|nr:hypothetical protein C8035_v001023 [Colletotrichum spinosum]